MCSTGGGNSFFESLLDAAVQWQTGGFVGFKKDEGGKDAGVYGKPVENTTKDITGATSKEEQLKLQRQQMEEAKIAQAQERADVLARDAASALQQSRSAGSARSTRNGSTNVGSSSVNNLGGAERDFLGL